MIRLKLADAIRFSRECGEKRSHLFAPVLFWRYTFDSEEI